MSASEALASTTDPALAVDRHGVVGGWNRAAEEVFGRPAARVIGKHCWEVLAGRDEFGNLYCVPGCPLLTMANRHQAVSRCRLFFQTAARQAEEFQVTTLIIPAGGDGDSLVHVLSPGAACATAPGTVARGLSPNHARGALSEREREVLGLLAKGRDTGEIAELLCVSPATAANHIQHILYKLRVHNRLKAVVVGQQLGLI